MADDIEGTYTETDTERLLEFRRENTVVTIAQNRTGYGMLSVRTGPAGDEVERYYGFSMALDHAAEILGVSPNDLDVPDPATSMGM